MSQQREPESIPTLKLIPQKTMTMLDLATCLITIANTITRPLLRSIPMIQYTTNDSTLGTPTVVF